MLIVIAHGSRKPAWRTAVEKLVRSVQEETGSGRVGLAFMDHGPPRLSDAVAAAVADGTTAVRVLPLFLVSAGHVSADIRPRIEEMQKQYPQVEIELLPAIGEHPLFRDILVEIAGRFPEQSDPEPLSETGS